MTQIQDGAGLGAYADVNGVRMYYEVSGDGPPLLLLHGGFGGTHIFGAQVPAFSQRHRVFVPEMRGRGHTADVPGPITYQVMADDVVAFIDHVVGEPVHFVGGSDGGVVGLLVALRRPDLVRKLVTIGSNFRREGLLGIEMWTEGRADDEAWAGARQRYGAVSPDGPQHFAAVFAKMQEMWRNGQPTLTVNDLHRIELPVLVAVGDDDNIDHGHTVALYEALPRGQLAVIPGTSHGVFLEKPDLLNGIVLDFLAEETDPQTILRVRRRPRDF